MVIVVKRGDSVAVYKSLDELRSALGDLANDVVLISFLNASAADLARKCGSLEECVDDRLIIYTKDPDFVKGLGVAVEEVFDLGGEYAVVVSGRPEVLLSLVADGRVTKAEKVRKVRAL